MRGHEGVLDLIPPRAGAIALVRYRLAIGSVALFDRLRNEKSVLITPGAHFGIGKYLRIGYGYDLGKVREGLSRIDELIAEFDVSADPGNASDECPNCEDGRLGFPCNGRVFGG